MVPLRGFALVSFGQAFKTTSWMVWPSLFSQAYLRSFFMWTEYEAARIALGDVNTSHPHHHRLSRGAFWRRCLPYISDDLPWVSSQNIDHKYSILIHTHCYLDFDCSACFVVYPDCALQSPHIARTVCVFSILQITHGPTRHHFHG